MSNALLTSRGELSLGADSLQLSDFERDLAQKLLRPETMMLFADDRFIGYLAERLILAGLNLPISQVQGFIGFTAQAADRLSDDATVTSTTFDDPATGAAGPSITGLAPGEYLILFGARVQAASAANLFAGVKVNSTEATDDDSVVTSTTTAHPGMTGIVKTLSSASNTLTMRYRTTSGTANLKYRWMIAVKTANL